MARTFNCGIGMVVDRRCGSDADGVSAAPRRGRRDGLRIGRIEAGAARLHRHRPRTGPHGPRPIMRDPTARRRAHFRPRQQHARAGRARPGGYEVALVASNKPHAPGLGLGARATAFQPGPGTARAWTRSVFDRALSAALEDHRVGTIALAGFMRILSAVVHRANGADASSTSTLRCSPSIAASTRTPVPLKPETRVSGCSVHLVTEELDAGDVLGQAEVPIESGRYGGKT